MKKLLNLILVLLFIFPVILHAQKVAVKTNSLYLATTTPNLSVEVAHSPKLTLDLQGSYNPWTFRSEGVNRKFKHWMVQPELRFWVYEKFDGHFLGIHPFYLNYNAGNLNLPLSIWPNLNYHRYRGYGTGVGFGYGYPWYLGHHWNLEFEFGFGYSFLNYDIY